MLDSHNILFLRLPLSPLLVFSFYHDDVDDDDDMMQRTHTRYFFLFK